MSIVKKLNLDTPGKRLRAARAYAAPARHEFCSRFGLSESTLKAWENDVALLSHKGAVQMSKFFSNFGIHCTVDWLLYGKEPSPLRSFFDSTQPYQSEKIDIEREFLLLKDYYGKSMSLLEIKDMSMAPVYKEGETVAGIEIEDKLWPYHWGNIVIAKPRGHDTCLRRLDKGSRPGFFNLVALSPASRQLIDVTLDKVYYLIWHRVPIACLESINIPGRAIA